MGVCSSAFGHEGFSLDVLIQPEKLVTGHILRHYPESVCFRGSGELLSDPDAGLPADPMEKHAYTTGVPFF